MPVSVPGRRVERAGVAAARRRHRAGTGHRPSRRGHVARRRAWRADQVPLSRRRDANDDRAAVPRRRGAARAGRVSTPRGVLRPARVGLSGRPRARRRRLLPGSPGTPEGRALGGWRLHAVDGVGRRRRPERAALVMPPHAPALRRASDPGARAVVALSPKSLGVLAARERTLAALIERTGAGDHAALEQLYDQTCAHVYSVAFRVLRDQSSASEVVVDVFARLARRATRYDPGRGSPSAWLGMQARSRAIDRHRTESRRRAREITLTEEMENEIVGSAETGPELSARRELHRAVHAALAGLSAPQRHVIEFAFYSGWSQSEIAAALGE